MAGLSGHNPLGRFSGLADVYARCRPTYPDAAIDCIMERCVLGPRSLLVDVGCGTGISSRLFAALAVPVIGIEPNAEMRRRAETEIVPSGMPMPKYQESQAEATGLRDGMADVVLAAQAFHWFDPERALCEFHRILKRGGWTALLWNERDEADPFTTEYGGIVRSTADAAAIEVPRCRAGEPLLVHPLFQDAERLVFPNEQILDEVGLLGRALSASYAPKERAAVEGFAATLREVFARFQHDRQVVIRYETTLYLARRRDVAA
ncbi:MAG TPA: class I SAM-dependent methyltransferase [Gemmataceae bacterium]